ncbi:MAG TPA: glycosyltransferase family 1 protein [bacterium]|nr:glycosyltransferase family 1 protein [bacterium]HOL47643.1 glycosyltransferase family 1 protein [bacterium]
MFKIGIELTPAIEQKTGIGNVSYLIAKNIIKFCEERDFYFKYIYNFIKTKNRKELLLNSEKNKNYIIPLPKRIYYNLYKYKIPINFFVSSLDILHITGLIKISVFKKTKIISTIHDIAFKILADFYDDSFVKELDDRIRYLCDKSIFIITSSFSTKNDLIKFYNVPFKKIKVVYFTEDEIFRKKKENYELENFRKNNKLPEHYFLFVGSLEKRKNLKNIIYAFQKFKKYDIKNFYLIIIGKDNEKIRKEINFDDNIIFTGYVKDADLPYYYHFADGLLYCSYYEGFGLPILEAFSSQIPVITTNNSSMSELAGAAGIYVNEPENINEISEKMLYLANIKNDEKENLLKIEREILKKFEIKECIKKILECYKEIKNNDFSVV